MRNLGRTDMTRDELILSCQDTVRNLVRKYNNHKLDEDLEAVGMTAVIVCVDKCLDEGLTDVDQVQRRCNTWARNRILHHIYREKIKFTDDNSVLDYLEADEDLWETIQDVKSVLTERNNEVFELLLEGYSEDEILKKLGMSRGTFFNHLSKIRQKIKSLVVKNDTV